jgi:hypothetical protein
MHARYQQTLARESAFARANFNSLLEVSTAQIWDFAGAYTKKRTEYRRKRELRLPPLDLLLYEVRSLQSHVFGLVAEFESQE